MNDTHRDLTRLAEALGECAARLAHDEDPASRADEVRRVLHATAADLSRHAAAMRRLDDESDLLRRRRPPQAELRELTARRDREIARVTAGIDASTRALLPGGDHLDPAVILRRLGVATRPFSWAVDRPERVRALAALLRRGSHARRPFAHTRGGAVVITVLPRRHRLARLHRRLRGARIDQTTPEVTA
ncbi:MAG: hypothetical protein Q4G43_03025 [Mobilicoccus sp.]|nr:hypothetical protein [Mobilicoccus sp.]